MAFLRSSTTGNHRNRKGFYINAAFVAHRNEAFCSVCVGAIKLGLRR